MHPDTFDVVVIGSGFGGAIAANRLALAGQRVLVLERGPWRDSVPVRSMGIAQRAPFPVGKHGLTHFLRGVHGRRFSLRFNTRGMFELTAFSGLYAMAASAVGGSSTAYGGLLEPPRQPGYWQARHPQLDASAVERYYDKIVSDMGGKRITRSQATPHSLWDHFPDPDNAACRPASVQPLVAQLLPETAEQIGQPVRDARTGVERHYCAFDGDGFLGSPTGAKASVDFVYLAPVLGQGVVVRDLCEVSRLRRSGASAYAVDFKDLRSGSAHTVAAAQVVLAAGALNTVRLLFASTSTSASTDNADGADALAPMPALGHGVFANGDLIGGWVKPTAALDSCHSSAALGVLSLAGHEDKMVCLGSMVGFDSWPLPGFVKRYLSRVFMFYGMAADSHRARLHMVKGRLQSDYDYRQEPIYAAMRTAFAAIQQASGLPVWALKKPLSPHVGGGARLGASPQEGVVDHRGEVYGNPGLFVTDGAALPAAPGGPPAVAIAAWAHHVADGMVGTAP